MGNLKKQQKIQVGRGKVSAAISIAQHEEAIGRSRIPDKKYPFFLIASHREAIRS